MDWFDWLAEIILLCASLYGALYGIEWGLKRGWRWGKGGDHKEDSE